MGISPNFGCLGVEIAALNVFTPAEFSIISIASASVFCAIDLANVFVELKVRSKDARNPSILYL